MLPRPALTFALGAVLCPISSWAQSQPEILRPSQSAPPAYVAVVDGAASIEREGRVETAPLNMPVVSGDRLRTAEGRMEGRLADGSTLDLDARAAPARPSVGHAAAPDGRPRAVDGRAGAA